MNMNNKKFSNLSILLLRAHLWLHTWWLTCIRIICIIFVVWDSLLYEFVILKTICTAILAIINGRLLDLQLRLGRYASNYSLPLGVFILRKTLIYRMTSHREVFLQTLIQTLCFYRVRKLGVPSHIVIIIDTSGVIYYKFIQLRHI